MSNISEITKKAALAFEQYAFTTPLQRAHFLETIATNIEALACGTPVVTYNTGGSPEAIDNETGISVRKADISGLKSSIEKIISIGKPHYLPLCRKRAEEYFNMDDRYVEYLNIFTRMVQRNN